MAREAVMTRKHYEMIAGLINTLDLSQVRFNVNSGARGSEYNQPAFREYVADTFAKLFAASDRSFSTELFLAGALKGDRKRAAKLTNGAAASSQNGGQKFTETENTGRDF